MVWYGMAWHGMAWHGNSLFDITEKYIVIATIFDEMHDISGDYTKTT